DHDAVARLLHLQLEQHRGGPRRLEVQKRLAGLLAGPLDDAEGAWTLLEQIVVSDPSDHIMRRLLRQLAGRLDKLQDAAKLLSRASTLARDPLVKALVTIEAARIV